MDMIRVHPLWPALGLLAKLGARTAFADSTPPDSQSPSPVSAEDIVIVDTAEDFLRAINGLVVRHVVIRSHLNVTTSNSTSAADIQEALLRLPPTLKHIQGDCIEDFPTGHPRMPRQCVLNVRQSFLEVLEASRVRLVNLYVTSTAPFATSSSPPSATSTAPAEIEQSTSSSEMTDEDARYISYLQIYKAEVWMYNVTLEGEGQTSVEGVNVLGASSTTGRAYAQGCVFTGFRSDSGAAWSIRTSSSRSDDTAASASFRDCVFSDNVALRSGGAVYMERGGALRLENCTFEGNLAPDGADVAVEDSEPDVFAAPPLIVYTTGGSIRAGDHMDVASQSLAAAASASAEFIDIDDEFDSTIAAEFAGLYTLQPLPMPAADNQAPVAAAPSPLPPTSLDAVRDNTNGANSAIWGGAASPGPEDIAPAPVSPAEATAEASSAMGMLQEEDGNASLMDTGGEGGGGGLPNGALVSTLAAAAVLAVFLVALLLFVSKRKAQRRLVRDAVDEEAEARASAEAAAAATGSGMEVVDGSGGVGGCTDGMRVVYVLPRIQEEATGDLATSSDILPSSDSDSIRLQTDASSSTVFLPPTGRP